MVCMLVNEIGVGKYNREPSDQYIIWTFIGVANLLNDVYYYICKMYSGSITSFIQCTSILMI